MRGFDIANELEFTIHGIEEMKITLVHKTNHLKHDDKIPTAVLQQMQSSSQESQDTQDSSCSNDTRKGSEDADEEESLVQMSYNLANRDESIGESSLLQDLKFLREEAWAMKKAKKLRKLKKVQFKDLQPARFQRKCCSNVKHDKSNYLKESHKQQESLCMKGDGESNNCRNTFKTPEKQGKCSSQTDPKDRARPVATLHSIDMFGSIIPRNLFPVSSNSRSFTLSCNHTNSFNTKMSNYEI